MKVKDFIEFAEKHDLGEYELKFSKEGLTTDIKFDYADLVNKEVVLSEDYKED